MTAQIQTLPAQDDALFNGLKKMCVPDYFTSDSPVLRPLAIELEGEPWVGFSEGHIMVVIRGAREGVEPYAGKSGKGLGRVAELLVTFENGTWHRGVDFPALRNWIDVSKVGKCPVCEGTGLEREDLTDEAIDERINGICEPRYGRLFGRLVQRAIVELPFAHLKAETVDVFIPDTDSEPIVVTSDDWRLLWMPITTDRGQQLDGFPA